MVDDPGSRHGIRPAARAGAFLYEGWLWRVRPGLSESPDRAHEERPHRDAYLHSPAAPRGPTGSGNRRSRSSVRGPPGCVCWSGPQPRRISGVGLFAEDPSVSYGGRLGRSEAGLVGSPVHLQGPLLRLERPCRDSSAPAETPPSPVGCCDGPCRRCQGRPTWRRICMLHRRILRFLPRIALD